MAEKIDSKVAISCWGCVSDRWSASCSHRNPVKEVENTYRRRKRGE